MFCSYLKILAQGSTYWQRPQGNCNRSSMLAHPKKAVQPVGRHGNKPTGGVVRLKIRAEDCSWCYPSCYFTTTYPHPLISHKAYFSPAPPVWPQASPILPKSSRKSILRRSQARCSHYLLAADPPTACTSCCPTTSSVTCATGFAGLLQLPL